MSLVEGSPGYEVVQSNKASDKSFPSYLWIQPTPFITKLLLGYYLHRNSRVGALEIKIQNSLNQQGKYHTTTVKTPNNGVYHTGIQAHTRAYANANWIKTDRNLVVEEEIYLSLMLLTHNSLRTSKKQEFSTKYFGPYKILAKVGNRVYKLELSMSTQIHKVFYVLLHATNNKSKWIFVIVLSDFTENDSEPNFFP